MTETAKASTGQDSGVFQKVKEEESGEKMKSLLSEFQTNGTEISTSNIMV